MIDEPQLQECQVIPTAKEPNIIEPENMNNRRHNILSMELRTLMQLQNETRDIEVEFFQRVYQLEIEFQQRHDEVYQKRCEIVNGEYIPTVAEKRSSDEKEDTEQGTSLPKEKHVGVSYFWLNILTASLPDIHPNDRPILEHLTDVRGTTKPPPEFGFVLEFHFSPNEYFEDAVLRKEYFYTKSDNKMIHEVPLIRQSVGCEIHWKDGKTPTYRTWFDFLTSSKIISDSDEEFMAYISGIQKDFEMGYFIKEYIIPKAVLFFTGEERHQFTISNYNPGFWSPIPGSISSSDDDSQIGSERSAGDQEKTEPE